MRSLDLSAASHKGKVRFIHEDHMSLPIERQVDLLASKGHLVAVSDGAGGQASGMIAAEIATRLVSNTYYSDPDEDIAASLRRAFAAAQEAIQQEQANTPDHAEMTTTLCVAVLRGIELVVANVGNSRCYRWRKGILRQLSNDHSEVGERVRSGIMPPEKLSKERALHGQLTRMLGSVKASAEPEIAEYDWQADDRLLLCTDGVWDMLPNDKINELLAKPEKSVDQIADSFVAAANEVGGADNITAVVVLDTLSLPPALRHQKPKVNKVKYIAGIGGALVAGAVLATAGARMINNRGAAAAPAATKTVAAIVQATPTAALATPTAEATAIATGEAISGTVGQGTPTPSANGSANGAAGAADAALKICARRAYRASQCTTGAESIGAKERTFYASWSYEALGKPTQFDVVLSLDGKEVYKATCKVQRGTRCAGIRNISTKSVTLSTATLKRKAFATGDYELQIVPSDGTGIKADFAVK